MKAKAIPDGFQTLTPSLVVRNAVAAIEFYERAFDAKRRRVFNAPDGSIVHAEIQIGDSIMMLSDEYPEMNIFSPQSPDGGTSASLFMYVEDADAGKEMFSRES